MNQSIATGELKFVQFHQPKMKDGDYQIRVTQTISTAPDQPFIAEKKFSVAGERFSINPQEIEAVFPANGNLGDHAYVLPHIILNRSTIPWERMSVFPQQGESEELEEARQRAPWLALILFSEDELQAVSEPETVAREKLIEHVKASTDSTSSYWPGAELEVCEHPDELVTVIDVEQQLLKAVLPEASDLEFLSHVRMTSDGEKAIVICNRLPHRGKTNIVHLVSLENRFFTDQTEKNSPQDLTSFQFNFDGTNSAEKVRLVSLKQWSFHCIDPEKSFKEVLTHLNLKKLGTIDTNVSQLVSELDRNFLPKEIAALLNSQLKIYKQLHVIQIEIQTSSPTRSLKQEHNSVWEVYSENVRVAVVELRQKASKAESLAVYYDLGSAVRMTLTKNKNANSYLSRGFVPMQHRMRSGADTVSWYHGPLVNWDQEYDINLPVEQADALVRFHPDTGMFDVSYAAAWELGRLMALNSVRFSTELFHWKRRHIQQLKSMEQKLLHPHLPGHQKEDLNADGIEAPEIITSWFNDQSLLKGVPFNYLITDEKLLPDESMRLFIIDQNWINCLLDGAFSVGRVSATDSARDRDLNQNVKRRHTDVSGVIIRSSLITDWPGLQIDAYDQFIQNEDFVPQKTELFRLADTQGAFLRKLRDHDLSSDLVILINRRLETIKLSEQSTKLSEDWEILDETENSWLLNDRMNHRRFNISVDKAELVFSIEPRLNLLRKEILSPGIMICLFEGVIKTLDIHQRPEKLHFGFEPPDTIHPRVYKKLRNKDGKALEKRNKDGQGEVMTEPVIYELNDQEFLSNRVIKINDFQANLSKQLKTHGFGESVNSAEFALQMIQGVEKVRFVGAP